MDRIAFRIVRAQPQGGLPPKMLLFCELETAPPVPFFIRMNGRGLDDPYAGHSPKVLVVERSEVSSFVGEVARVFGVAVPSLGARDIRIHWNTVLLENFSGFNADGDPHYEGEKTWRDDKWSLEEPEVEMFCDYCLAECRGAFSPKDDPDAILAVLARSTQRDGDYLGVDDNDDDL